MNGVNHTLSTSDQESLYEDTFQDGDASVRQQGVPVGISAQGYARGVSNLIQLMTELRANG